ncbi:hypothetical protein BWK57_12395 [Flavobacterium columnare]|uniref:hypothetical protein n=1 Tax=Flavobacterium columnare TaxID=996 RepID=UPI000CDB0C4A|nr:hypothetical protein [Flavobacterium columnare]POR20778.1 hypothetical protein BWK57_12395 [Flavobacterium columnare]
MNKQGNTITIEYTNKQDSFILSKVFRHDYLNITENPILIKQPILVTNLLFQIILDLKNNMFHTSDYYLNSDFDKKENQIKLNLWEDEFIDSDKNEIKKVYQTSFFLKNRDKKKMTEALEFLKKYKSETYAFTNKKGKKITTSGGLIKDWYFSDKTGNFEITISLYWADKIVRLEDKLWNNLNLNVLKEFKNNKQRMFILWLMEIKLYSGTKKKYEDILTVYNLNYSNIYEFMRGFLSPIKMKLDNKKLNNNWISFNYFVDENNSNNIQIIPYLVKPKKFLNISTDYIDSCEKNKDKYLKDFRAYKLKYIKRRHSLSDENCQKVKNLLIQDFELFETKYKFFLKTIRGEAKKAIDFKDFIFVCKLEEIYS